jgi:prophage maintenance system killer protein
MLGIASSSVREDLLATGREVAIEPGQGPGQHVAAAGITGHYHLMDVDQLPGRTLQSLLEAVSPIPLMGLEEEGARLLDALEWLEQNARKVPLREEVVRDYHRRISKPGVSGGGVYRSGQSLVHSSRIPRPGYQKVPSLMMHLGARLSSGQEELDRDSTDDGVLTFAFQVHQRIAYIHPFPDGNGRVARLAMNHILRRYGRGYVILPPISESPEHHEALERAHSGDMEAFSKFARSHQVTV